MEMEEANSIDDTNINDPNMSVEHLATPKGTQEVVNGKENLPPEKKKLLRLPMNRIKHIMRLDPDCRLIRQDAVFLVTKATELFLAYMGAESARYAVSSKRKTVLRRDVDAVIDSVPNLCFLDGALE